MVMNKNNATTVIFDHTHYAPMSSFGFTLAFPSQSGYYAEKSPITLVLKISIKLTNLIHTGLKVANLLITSSKLR